MRLMGKWGYEKDKRAAFEELCQLAYKYDDATLQKKHKKKVGKRAYEANPPMIMNSWHVEIEKFKVGEPWAKINLCSSAFMINGNQKDDIVKMLELAEVLFFDERKSANGIGKEKVLSFCISTLAIKQEEKEKYESKI